MPVRVSKSKMARRYGKSSSVRPWSCSPPNRIATVQAEGPDQVWVSDITYVATAEGWLYLVAILDLFSRRVVGWKLGEGLSAELVSSALQNALVLRQPQAGLYFHSDRGSQYSSQAVRQPLQVIGAVQSMSRTGNCYDNANAEAFFSSLKTECFRRVTVLNPKLRLAERSSSTSRSTTITNVYIAR